MEKEKLLNDEKVQEVSGGKEEITIKPIDDEFWHSFNPNQLNPNSNNLDLINNYQAKGPTIKETKVEGSISNHDNN